jgi:hypothetical protein
MFQDSLPLVYADDPSVCLSLAPDFVYNMPLDEFDTWSVIYSWSVLHFVAAFPYYQPNIVEPLYHQRATFYEP